MTRKSPCSSGGRPLSRPIRERTPSPRSRQCCETSGYETWVYWFIVKLFASFVAMALNHILYRRQCFREVVCRQVRFGVDENSLSGRKAVRSAPAGISDVLHWQSILSRWNSRWLIHWYACPAWTVCRRACGTLSDRTLRWLPASSWLRSGAKDATYPPFAGRRAGNER